MFHVWLGNHQFYYNSKAELGTCVMIHVNPNLDGQGPKRAVAFLGAFRSLRFNKKKIEKKSIFLANCILFDDKLQKVQNNLVLGDF